jgi:hypothetical protein
MFTVKAKKAVPLHAMEAHGGERKYNSYSFLTSALDGDVYGYFYLFNLWFIS